MAKSKVKWFDGKKGYGFIVNPQGGGDIFVHYSVIVSDNRFRFLESGQDVEFEFETSEKGFQARVVRPVAVIASLSSIVQERGVMPPPFRMNGASA
jgi:CspA family cold shock protein